MPNGLAEITAFSLLACALQGQVGWTQVTPRIMPPWGFGLAVVYDSHRDVIVRFGGDQQRTAPLGRHQPSPETTPLGRRSRRHEFARM